MSQLPYLDAVVISLDRADEAGYRKSLEYFRRMKRRTVVLWNDGPGVTALLSRLAENDLRLGERGKGRACWMAFGYLLAAGHEHVALQDADVLDYDRAALSRLLYPLVNPILNFDFCKGYYARFTDRLNGRVVRLFVWPLLSALSALLGSHPYLEFLSAFRYPLAGEFALSADLLRQVRVPADWGLEIGVLSEVFRHLSPRRVCQVDLTDRYDHKHQALSPDDASTGLNRMAGDIAKHLLRTLAAADVVLSEGALKSLLASYQRRAEDAHQRLLRALPLQRPRLQAARGGVRGRDVRERAQVGHRTVPPRPARGAAHPELGPRPRRRTGRGRPAPRGRRVGGRHPDALSGGRGGAGGRAGER